MDKIELTGEQRQAIDEICHWLDNFDVKKKRRHILTGYAGTGKSTVISDLVYNLDRYIDIPFDSIAVVTFTWKAADVLKKKGIPQASSIHRLIYDVVVDNKTGEFHCYRKSISDLQSQCELIIVDEASMTNKEIRDDLESYEIPILYVKDNFQLGPIKKEDSTDSFLTHVDSSLTQIHRQALENPIIAMSMEIRNGVSYFEPGNYKNCVFVRNGNSLPSKHLLDAEQIICGYNATRIYLNNQIRELKGFDPTSYPAIGEKLIALSNCHKYGIFNGQMFVNVQNQQMFKHIPHEIRTIKLINDECIGQNVKTYFTDVGNPKDTKYPYKDKTLVQFAYGYAITCHKAQGSQFGRTIVFNEPVGRTEEDKLRWLYTAITRTIDKMILLQ